ncbi:hypothetical protein C5167_002996 [Papaver somniferum]|uniref:Uncharacterized protein n=2 Tax=Papaver somniferum TaxID=3469 RepID=A0A4Y7L2F5_PAPSO|nr:hypothetical protein C5167_002996 [Papaver somniferum]
MIKLVTFTSVQAFYVPVGYFLSISLSLECVCIYLLIVLPYPSPSHIGVDRFEVARIFTIINDCKETVSSKIFGGGGFLLKPGQSVVVFTAPVCWSHRIWGRIVSHFDKAGNGTCQTGVIDIGSGGGGGIGLRVGDGGVTVMERWRLLLSCFQLIER